MERVMFDAHELFEKVYNRLTRFFHGRISGNARGHSRQCPDPDYFRQRSV